MARRYKPTSQDLEVMELAASPDTGGASAFTSYFFAPIHGTPRPEYVGTPPDTWKLSGRDYVPWIMLDWQFIVAHDSRPDSTIVGGYGCGKTIGLGAVGCYWACQIPNFRFMNVAPVGWQAKQMYDKIRQDLVDYDNRFENPTRISRMVTKMVERPWPKIVWWNGSSMEFMSADEQGSKILSWEGDVAVIDEAGKYTDGLEELFMNLGSRMRGMTRGRERMGKMIVMGNADDNPELWERFDAAKEMPNEYFSLHLTTYDNPYLTQRQLGAIERRITDPQKRRQFMMAERPLPRGKEFPPQLLERAIDTSLDDRMQHGLENDLPHYRMDKMAKAGTVTWQLPPEEGHQYLVIGDPGQSAPPFRNSACIVVVDSTHFPHSSATLAGFWWGPQNKAGLGSYWPFIYKVEEFATLYRPISIAFDATGTQKGLDELVFAQRGLLVEGLNLQYMKMQMVTTLKLLMGRDLLSMPRKIESIWLQLAGWRMPDKRLRQDVACTLFMAAHVLQRQFVPVGQVEMVLDEGDMTGPVTDRWGDTRRLRGSRHGRLRG